MKLSEYLVFAVLLIPTLVVAAAAVLLLTAPDPAPEYRAPAMTVSSVGLYPNELHTDE